MAALGLQRFLRLSSIGLREKRPSPSAIVPALLDLSGAAPRVAIADASYFINSTASTDTAYVAALKASSINKTIPSPSQQIPAGSVGYVMLRLPSTDASSPPIFINWDGAAAQPSSASPMVPTVLISTDANMSAAPAPTNGTFVQDTSFSVFRTSGTDNYVSRGQRYNIDTVAPARDVMIRFDLTNASITQNVTPHICCSSGQWMWVVGNSIVRNMYTNLASYNLGRAAVMAAVPGSDPFFFVTARAGANQAAIKSEQVDPVVSNAILKKFIRAIYVNPWVHEISYVSQNVRPYSVAAGNGEASVIRGRTDALLTALKSLNTVVVAPDCSFLNFTSADATNNATPYVNSDFQSPNGSFPYNQNVFGPAIVANIPISWNATYAIPFCSDYAGIAEKFETDTSYTTGSSVEPNATGYTNWRPRRAPLDRLMYGQPAGANTLQTRVAALGSTTTTALKTRLQSVFDAVFAMYPTADSTVQSNRAALRAQLDAITAT